MFGGCIGIIEYIEGSYRDNGKENGNYFLGSRVYRDPKQLNPKVETMGPWYGALNLGR